MPTFSWTNSFSNQNLTREQFITNLRTRIDEDVSDTISDSQLFELIKQGLYDINFETGLLPEYCTVALDGSTTYTLPSDLNTLGSIVHIDASSPTNYRLLRTINLPQLQEEGYDPGTIDYYIRNGDSIDIYGSSVATGELRAYGSRIPTYPESGSSYIDIPDVYIELLYLWCEWKFWSRRRDDTNMKFYEELYRSRLKKSRDQIEKEFSLGVSMYG